MKSKKKTAADLEAELVHLTTLVRARRRQLAQLTKCPHKDCECRQVWQEVVERNLACQMGKIRRHVGPRAAKKS